MFKTYGRKILSYTVFQKGACMEEFTYTLLLVVKGNSVKIIPLSFGQLQIVESDRGHVFFKFLTCTNEKAETTKKKLPSGKQY